MMSIKSNLCIKQCCCCCINASRPNSITDFVRFIYLYLKQQRLKFNSKQYSIHNNLLFQCNGLSPFKLDYNLFNQNIQIIIIIKDRNLLSTMTTSTFVHVFFHFDFIDFSLVGR